MECDWQPPDDSARRRSARVGGRPERVDAARGAVASGRRIPRRRDRAGRQRDGLGGARGLDGRERQSSLQRGSRRGHQHRQPHHRDVCRRERTFRGRDGDLRILVAVRPRGGRRHGARARRGVDRPDPCRAGTGGARGTGRRRDDPPDRRAARRGAVRNRVRPLVDARSGGTHSPRLASVRHLPRRHCVGADRRVPAPNVHDAGGRRSRSHRNDLARAGVRGIRQCERAAGGSCLPRCAGGREVRPWDSGSACSW